MGECVMCGAECDGTYELDSGEKVYICFEHYEDLTFQVWLRENTDELGENDGSR